MSFQVNPLTEDLIAIKNQSAIARSLRNLCLCKRTILIIIWVQESMNCQNMDDITASSIKGEIENTKK